MARFCAFSLSLFALGLSFGLNAAPTTAPSSQPATTWHQLPPSGWPQLVLTNEASFADHSALHGASSFLMRMPDGEIVVGTAKHLIKSAGGVEPPIDLPTLDSVLKRWQVFPRTKMAASIDVKGLAEPSDRENRHDWLLLHLVGHPTNLPATPLVPRETPVAIGERVFLVGVPYDDRMSSQHVYAGTVTARPMSHYFTYEFDPPVHIPGFSGAPIVDVNGLLVGHGVSRQRELKQKDGREIEFGGEDASLALDLWNHRNDSPTTKAASTLTMELPKGWTATKPVLPHALKAGESTTFPGGFEASAVSKDNLVGEIDLMTFAKRYREGTIKKSTLQNRKDTDPKENTVGDRKTIEYETQGELKGRSLHFRVIIFEANNHIVVLSCVTTEAQWDAVHAKFDDLVNAIK